MSGCVMSDWISMSKLFLDCINKLSETAGSLTLCNIVNIYVIRMYYLFTHQKFMTNKMHKYYTFMFYLFYIHLLQITEIIYNCTLFTKGREKYIRTNNTVIKK